MIDIFDNTGIFHLLLSKEVNTEIRLEKHNRVSIIIAALIVAIMGGATVATAVIAAPLRPSDADLMAFKVYHHTMYKVTTTKHVGGTNKLLHTTELPTEGTDPVVTPALDRPILKLV